MFERNVVGYGWPSFGHRAELRSLAWHSGRRDGLRTDGPVGAELQAIRSYLAAMFHTATWSIPSDFMERSHYERVLKRLDWTSSPGYPYMRSGPTNGDLFRVVDGIPDPARVEHFWQIVQQQILTGNADPIRLFVKAEPHKLAKIENGRYRLISSVSVVDQLIDHMLFGDFNQVLIDECVFIPSKAGWSQYGGGWRMMPREPWMALDKSSWDWTVHGWLVDMVLAFRAQQCNNMHDRWMQLARWRYERLFGDPVFVTSGGLLLRQKQPGVMKSGCVNTISDNSIMQVILHLRVSYEMGVEPGPIYTMGDDTLQAPVERLDDYMRAISQFSIVKEMTLENEFAGCRFHGRRVEPLYRGKHAFNLLHLNGDYVQQIADSYVLLYHRSAYRDLIEDLFLSMGQKFLTREQRDAIYDGE